jgi:hypothetical protein
VGEWLAVLVTSMTAGKTAFYLYFVCIRSINIMAKNNEVAAVTASMPAFLQAQLGQHQQQLVDAEDVGIPRLKLLQPLSPEVSEHDASAGTFFNTVTMDTMASVAVSNLGFERNYLVVGDQTKGGDRTMFVGAFPTEAAAKAAIAEAENGDMLTISVSHRHFLRLIDTGEVVAMDFANTAVNVSKLWNAQIMAESNLPRSAKFYMLTAAKKKNDKGFWYVPEVKANGYVQDEQMYNKLVKLENSFKRQAA